MTRLVCAFLLTLSAVSPALAETFTYANYTLSYMSAGSSEAVKFSVLNGVPIPAQNSTYVVSGLTTDPVPYAATAQLDFVGYFISYEIFPDPSDTITISAYGTNTYLDATDIEFSNPGTYTFVAAYYQSTFDGVASPFLDLQNASLTITDSMEPTPGSPLFGPGAAEYVELPLPLPAAPAATPEPSSLCLLGSGLAGLASAARRRKRSQR